MQTVGYDEAKQSLFAIMRTRLKMRQISYTLTWDVNYISHQRFLLLSAYSYFTLRICNTQLQLPFYIYLFIFYSVY